MKKLLILMFVVFGSANTFCQEYHKLINESMYWDVSYSAMGYICSGYSESPPYRFSFSGDTIIDGKQYAKTYYQTFITLTPPINCGAFEVDTIPHLSSYYFLREDTLEQRVWRYDIYDNEEYLLFDFSLEKGDTLYSYLIASPVIIDTTYYITTDDGIERKKLEINQWIDGYFIEGIGGVAGPFEQPFDIFESGDWLMCVKNSNENVILDIGGHCFNFITGTETIPSREGMKVYFDSGSDRTIIQLNDAIAGTELVLFNTSGMIVKKTMLQPYKREYEFTVSGLPAGLYVVVLFDEGKVADKRKVVINH